MRRESIEHVIINLLPDQGKQQASVPLSNKDQRVSDPLGWLRRQLSIWVAISGFYRWRRIKNSSVKITRGRYGNCLSAECFDRFHEYRIVGFNGSEWVDPVW